MKKRRKPVLLASLLLCAAMCFCGCSAAEEEKRPSEQIRSQLEQAADAFAQAANQAERLLS